MANDIVNCRPFMVACQKLYIFAKLGQVSGPSSKAKNNRYTVSSRYPKSFSESRRMRPQRGAIRQRPAARDFRRAILS